MRSHTNASQAPFSARVARNLGRSAINTAYQARQVGRGVSDVARAVAFERHLAKAKRRQLAGDAKALLRRVGASADPRVIAGGFAGWTAGEVLGGAVGGVFGTLVGGPVGTLVGVNVGALTGGMLGLKVGTDVVQDIVEAPSVNPAQRPVGQAGAPIKSGKNRKSTKRFGEIAGITTGASVGVLVAGPIGGIAFGVIGQIVGGQVAQETTRAAPRDVS